MVIIYFVILVSMRAFTALLLILFSLLQYRLWFGKNSVPDYYALQDEVTRQQSTNEKLKQRNKLLYADTDDLKLGSEAIEERARNELGMIKQDETFFRIIPNQDKHSSLNQGER
jgi:cell division protein FtsB